jgi:hypothetical protein
MIKAPDEVRVLVERLSPDEICDDCISERLELSVRQQASELVRSRGFIGKKTAARLRRSEAGDPPEADRESAAAIRLMKGDELNLAHLSGDASIAAACDTEEVGLSALACCRWFDRLQRVGEC